MKVDFVRSSVNDQVVYAGNHPTYFYHSRPAVGYRVSPFDIAVSQPIGESLWIKELNEADRQS